MVSNPRFLVLVAWSAVVACTEQGPADQDRLERWAVGPEPVVTIGGEDDREGYLTQRVVGMTRLSNGRIVVADGGSQQIRLYDSTGVHVRTIGGFGGGPGEFSQLLSVVRGDADTIYALSRRPGLTIFTPEGDFVDQVRVNSSSVPPRCYYAEETTVSVGPSIVATAQLNRGLSGCPELSEGLERDSVLVVRHNPMSGDSEVLARAPGVERVASDFRPYGTMPINSWGWNRGVVGGTDSGEVMVVAITGEVLNHVTVPWETQAVPQSARREVVQERNRGDGSVEIGEPWNYPERYPRVGRVVYDPTGWIWFMRYPRLETPGLSPFVRRPMFGGRIGVEDGSEWRVMPERDAAYPVEVSLPAGFHLWEAGPGYVLGLHRDQFDLDTVQLYERHAS